AKEKLKKGEGQNSRIAFDYTAEGGLVSDYQRKTLYIDKSGKVYESVDAENPIDHFKNDNFGLMIYKHNPVLPSVSGAASTTKFYDAFTAKFPVNSPEWKLVDWLLRQERKTMGEMTPDHFINALFAGMAHFNRAVEKQTTPVVEGTPLFKGLDWTRKLLLFAREQNWDLPQDPVLAQFEKNCSLLDLLFLQELMVASVGSTHAKILFSAIQPESPLVHELAGICRSMEKIGPIEFKNIVYILTLSVAKRLQEGNPDALAQAENLNQLIEDAGGAGLPEIHELFALDDIKAADTVIMDAISRSRAAQKQAKPAETPPFSTASEHAEVLLGDAPVQRFMARQATSDMGEFAATTDQGRGYGHANEDAVGFAYDPEGNLVLVDNDGMGGTDAGADAARIAVGTFVQGVRNGTDPAQGLTGAHQAIRAFIEVKKQTRGREFNAGAVATALRVKKPASAGGPHTVDFYWAGDTKGMLLRRGPDGNWAWIYRTVEDGYTSQLIKPGVDFEEGGFRRTMAFVSHPQANIVMNCLGTEDGVKVRTTAEGELPAPSEKSGVRQATELKDGIALQDGDLALLGSDGFWENFGFTQYILDLIKDCATAEEAISVLVKEAHYRMEVLSMAREALDKGQGTYGRVLFEYNGAYAPFKGVTLCIDENGNVFADFNGTIQVDHYKTDNISVMGYKHNPVREGVQEVASPVRTGHTLDFPPPPLRTPESPRLPTPRATIQLVPPQRTPVPPAKGPAAQVRAARQSIRMTPPPMRQTSATLSEKAGSVLTQDMGYFLDPDSQYQAWIEGFPHELLAELADEGVDLADLHQRFLFGDEVARMGNDARIEYMIINLPSGANTMSAKGASATQRQVYLHWRALMGFTVSETGLKRIYADSESATLESWDRFT
ncbi:MAG: hypothetical protein Q7T11_04270, partial [Deltaproteobacteria bacterium]|nr:hypothetical protein [Deltaproteobacteria bacterium]